MSSVHCFVSNGSVWYVPASSFINLDTNEARRDKSRKDTCFDTSNLEETTVMKNKSLLLKLNSPSLSDVENDINEEEHEKTTINDNTNVCATDGTQISEIVNDSTIHALYFPDFVLEMQGDIKNMFGPIKNFLANIFPRDWLNPDDIELEGLKGGITNMLLSCLNRRTNKIVLMRVYGRGTNLINDRHREFVLHLVLTSLHLAPAIYARFKNGLVYEYIPGRSLIPEEMQRPGIYPLIAQRLGIWHDTVNCNDIDAGVDKLRQYTKSLKNNLTIKTKNKSSNKKPDWKKENISNVWKLLEDWIRIVPIIPELIESFENNFHEVEVNSANIRSLIMKEFDFLLAKTSAVESPLVSAHCDLLSGNIILPLETIQSDNDSPITLPSNSDNPVSFIDYEYMLTAPRAFDIANHLAEWQGFDCNRAAIPEPTSSNPVFIRWIEAYLNDKATSEGISKLTNEVALFLGMPGFYWGIWAMIQSEISNIDFDYAKYGRQRLQEYWDWKHNL